MSAKNDMLMQDCLPVLKLATQTTLKYNIGLPSPYEGPFSIYPFKTACQCKTATLENLMLACCKFIWVVSKYFKVLQIKINILDFVN